MRWGWTCLRWWRIGRLMGRGDLRDQLQGASLSISNNIAEGFERGTTDAWLWLLYIARGPAGPLARRPGLARRSQSIPAGDRSDDAKPSNDLVRVDRLALAGAAVRLSGLLEPAGQRQGTGGRHRRRGRGAGGGAHRRQGP